MSNRRKTLISLLCSFLIVIFIITSNRTLNIKNENNKVNKNTVKNKSSWIKPEGNLSSIKIYLDEVNNKIIATKEENYNSYKYLNEYKCFSSDCKSYEYNIYNNHIIIKDKGYIIYDYKTNLYKKITGLEGNYLNLKLLYFNNEDFGIALMDSYNNYAFYSLKESKVKTDYIYEDILTNEASYLEGCFIGITVLDNKVLYNIINYNNGDIVGISDKRIGTIGNKNSIYYYTEENINNNIKFKIYNDKFNEIRKDSIYSLYGVTNAGNLVASEDNLNFAIYNKNGKLIKESKPYKQVYLIINKYIIVKDNDNILKIIDFDSNVIKKVTSINDSMDFISGEYMSKDKLINIIIFDNNENKKILYSYSLKNKNIMKKNIR